jgi:PEP-CTERM motif
MALCAASAKADTTYTYTGNRFTNLVDNAFYPALPIADVGDVSIQASITLASPLAPNLIQVFLNPISIKFTADGYTDTLANTSPITYPGYFNLSTNATGQIDLWNILVEGDSTKGGDAVIYFSSPGFAQAQVCPSCSYDSLFLSTNEYYYYNLNDSGSWTISTTGNSVPEPTSGTLLIAGLVGLAGLALKKSL